MLPSKGRGGSAGGGGGDIKDNKKMIFDRIQGVENAFGSLCSELSSFTKKKARLRDKYDELSVSFNQVGELEECNETIHNGLASYSKAMTLLADVTDLEVHRIHGKVVRELANYEVICKNTRELMKHSLLMRDKDLIRRHHIDQIKQRSQQKGVVMEKSSETNGETSKLCQELDQNIVTFERRKMEDIKQILLDLTLIQLKQHVKSMEILSATYQDIVAIDVDRDIDAFKSAKRETLSSSAGSLASPRRVVGLSNGQLSPASSAELDEADSMSDETSTSGSDEDDNDADETTSQDESDGNRGIFHARSRPMRVTADDDDEDEDYSVQQKGKMSSRAPTKPKGTQEVTKKPVPRARLSKIAQNQPAQSQ